MITYELNSEERIDIKGIEEITDDINEIHRIKDWETGDTMELVLERREFESKHESN